MTALGAPQKQVVVLEVLVDDNHPHLCHPACGFHTERRTCTLHVPGEPQMHKLKERQRTAVCLRVAGRVLP